MPDWFPRISGYVIRTRAIQVFLLVMVYYIIIGIGERLKRIIYPMPQTPSTNVENEDTTETPTSTEGGDDNNIVDNIDQEVKKEEVEDTDKKDLEESEDNKINSKESDSSMLD